MKNLGSFSSGRDQIRQQIDKRIQALHNGYRQNLGVIGPEGLGKTHLLSSLFSFYSQSPEMICLYVRADFLDFSQLAERWVQALLFGYFSNAKIPLPEKFVQWLTVAEPAIPKTIEKIKHLKKMLHRGEKNATSVRELFSLTGILAEETGKKILFMLDEFHALENLPAPDPFSLLGKEIMIEKETLYLVTSSKPEKAREIFHHKLSLLFGNFEMMDLAPFGFSECLNFLTNKTSNHLMEDAHKKFLIRMTDGMPVYLELLLDQLKDLCPEGIASEEQILESFYRELFDEKGRIALIFEKRVEVCRRLAKESDAYLKTLLAISDGRRKVLAIATYVEKKVRETKKILARLVQEEMISKRGSFYLIEDPLFRFWLREVFHRKNQMFIPDISIASEEFRRVLSHAFAKVEVEEKQDVTARAETLLKEFRNDVIEVNRRRIRCPHFSEVASRPSNGRLFPLFARNATSRWVCQVALEEVQEEDVTRFLEEVKRYRKGLQRKVFITLGGIHQNAKLMAQEAEIQLWDLKSFNSLLDLYNLPKLILIRETHESALGALA